MKHTKGKAYVSNYCEKTESYEIWIENHFVVKTMYCDEHKVEAQANAELIAEAFNVTSESGLTPSELLKQNKELLEALKEANNTLKVASLIDKSTQCEETQKLVQQAINNAKK